jgi:hypothetical protein
MVIFALFKFFSFIWFMQKPDLQNQFFLIQNQTFYIQNHRKCFISGFWACNRVFKAVYLHRLSKRNNPKQTSFKYETV